MTIINNNQEIKGKNINSQIFNMIEKFSDNKNIKHASIVMVEEICKIYKFHKGVILMIQNNDEIVNFFEYNNTTDIMQGEYKDFNSKNIIIGEYKTIGIDDYFNKKFNKRKYYYTENNKDIAEILIKLNHKPDDCKHTISDVSQMYGFSLGGTVLTGFLLFYNFKNNESQPEMSMDENKLNSLVSISKVLNRRVEEYRKTSVLRNETMFKDLILNNENVPFAIIEKNTYKILEQNDIYSRSFPFMSKDKVCYQAFGMIEPCENCCMHEDLEKIEYTACNKNHWLMKSIPVTMYDNVEANMVYGKDTFDYVEKLDMLDLLTNVISIKGMAKYYESEIRKNHYKYILCTIDVDKFKYINNLFGYHTGDEILKNIASTINSVLKKDEICCRINEDKFAFFMKYESREKINTRLIDLKAEFKKMKESLYKNKKITIIGGACFVDKDVELDELIDKANTARKKAKNHHENQIRFYDEELEKESEREKRIEEKMFNAITNDEFIPYLQAKFDLKTKKLCGAEALVRWIGSEGMIYPDEFIPIFEKNGFINTLDFIVYQKIMKFIRYCIDSDIPVCPISVNVSRGHIQDTEFVPKVMKLIKLYDIPINLLEFEVTESVYVEDKDELVRFIDHLKEENLRVSIDDFGTAYSSLHILKDINVDIIKIDKAFLSNLNLDINFDESSKDVILIKHIINMAKELKFKVVCEGIETEEQTELLCKIGCEVGQGYWFSKPIPLDDFVNNYFRKD